jgi:vacuolar-type H+-ATPase subunit H
VDVQAKLAEVRASVEAARAMPMSASCVVNRAELLGALDELAAMLPEAFGESDRVLAHRDEVIEKAREQARQIVADGQRRRDELVSDSDVFKLASTEAERMLTESRQETAALRRETDDYVDERLANFELTLAKTLEAVQRGRERLRGRSELDTLGKSGDDLVPLPDHGRD